MTLNNSKIHARSLEAEELEPNASLEHMAAGYERVASQTHSSNYDEPTRSRTRSSRLLKDWRINYADIFGLVALQGLASLALVVGVDWLLRNGTFYSTIISSPAWYSLEVARFGLGLLGVSLALPLAFAIFSQVMRSMRAREDAGCEDGLRSYLFSVESSFIASLLLLTGGTLANFLFSSTTSASLTPDSSLIFLAVTIAALLLMREKCMQLCSKKVGFTLVDKIPSVHVVHTEQNRDSLQSVDLYKVKIGDVYRVTAGAVIPLDAVVVAGTGEVEERKESGRSETVIRDRGQQVFAGSQVKTGSLDCRVVKPITGSRICSHAEHFENLVQAALSPSDEEHSFVTRSVQLVWLAAAFGAFAMYLRGAELLHICEVASAILLLVLMPLVVQWVPLLRAAIISNLFKHGSTLKSVDTLDQLEEVDNVVVCLPEALLEDDLPDESCSWEFLDLGVLDERYNENSLRSVLISLLSHSSAPCHTAIYQALRALNPDVLLYAVKSVEHYDLGCIRGKLDGAPLIFGNESFLLQHSVFIQASELEAAEKPQGSLGVPRTFFFAVGGEVVARVRMERRARFCGIEVGEALTKKGVRFSVVSQGNKEIVDRVGRFFGLELSQLSGGLSETEIAERLNRSEEYAVYAPGHMKKSNAEIGASLGAGPLTIAAVENGEHRGDVMLLDNDPSSFLGVFLAVRSGLLMRQVLMMGGVGCSFLLFLGVLFQVISSGQVALLVLCVLGAAFGFLYRYIQRSVVW